MDENDLDNKFSNLSVSASSFTPMAMRSPAAASPTSSVAAPTASWLAKAKPPQRRVPPAHQRQQQQKLNQQQQRPSASHSATPVAKAAPTPMSQWSSSTAAAAASGKARTQKAAVEPQSLLANGRSSAANGGPSPFPAADRRTRRQPIGSLGFARSGLSMNRRTPQNSTGPTSSSTAGSTSFNTRFQLGASQAPSPSDSVLSSTGARKRSESVGSEGDYSDDDDVYPDAVVPAATQAPSAFPERLMLLSQQKKVPMSVVSRDAVIDTVFSALFAKKDKARSGDGGGARRFSAFGDDDTSGTETDEPNEDFVKKGLAASLFKESLSGMTLQFQRGRGMTDQEAVERFITTPFIHTLVNDMRFEDFRTASARIDIVRAIHKSCPTKRIHIARALADAATQRLQYVQALLATAQELEIEKQRVMVKHANDHSHGFTDLLRYAIEHVGESLNGITGETADAAHISQRDVDEIVRNYLAALVAIWRTHWFDPAGSDDEELISCAGQFVAYIPRVAVDLLERLMRHWPTRFPTMEVVAIRMVARVIMTSPPLHTLEPTPRLPLKLFTRLAKCVRCPHTQVAQEALAFTGCQFAMVHFLGQYEAIYHVVTDAFHRNARSHWNDTIRATSEGHFDRALDYAP
jgi:hypothetical protein